MERKLLIMVISFLTLASVSLAQAPLQMNYQAVVRDASGTPVHGNDTVSVKFLIHDGSPGGGVEYQETTKCITNQFGLINYEIGAGGNLATVTWSSGSKYLQVEIDVAGGNNFTDMGTAQLLSVPYALFAANSGLGPTGPTGLAGTQGTAGTTGPAGTTGIIGATGLQGNAGQTGAQGPTGIQGPAGNIGLQGTTGATGIGIQGPSGNDGNPGQTGVQGPTGAQGPAGDTGNQGLTGAAGATGVEGPTGSDGNPGSIGIQGPTGLPGDVGPTGAQGSTGFDGNPGTTGAVGLTGTDGAQGPTGVPGATGATGFVASGSLAGNTPYWDGGQWVVNSSNIYNDGANIGIGTTTPGSQLDVNGNINAASGFTVAGAAANGNFLRGNGTNFVSSPILATDIPAGSTNYIQNGTSVQSSSNFNISGNGTVGTNLQVNGLLVLNPSSLGIVGGTSAAPVDLTGLLTSYIGLLPNGSNQYYQMPQASLYPGAVVFLRNNTTSTVAYLLPPTTGSLLYAANSNATYPAPSGYTINGASAPKTVLLVSDGLNWTVMSFGN